MVVLSASGLGVSTEHTLHVGGMVGYGMDLVGSSVNRYLDSRVPGQDYWNIGNNMTWIDLINDTINTAI